MKTLALLLCLLPTAALAVPNPFSCADVVFLEPGLACVEHFGYDAPDWASTLPFLPIADMDAKGGMYRGFRVQTTEPAVFCGGTRLSEYILYRYGAGHSQAAPDRKVPVLYIRDKCASSQVTAVAFAFRVKVLDSGQIVVVVTPTDLLTGNQAGWAFRISRPQ